MGEFYKTLPCSVNSLLYCHRLIIDNREMGSKRKLSTVVGKRIKKLVPGGIFKRKEKKDGHKDQLPEAQSHPREKKDGHEDQQSEAQSHPRKEEDGHEDQPLEAQIHQRKEEDGRKDQLPKAQSRPTTNHDRIVALEQKFANLAQFLGGSKGSFQAGGDGSVGEILDGLIEILQRRGFVQGVSVLGKIKFNFPHFLERSPISFLNITFFFPL